uniref:Ankyrin repeat protein n=1 Tax=Pithovirus LCPAC401 TaxID=2506595 RepID=A0A481ZAB3_9VIRU|nr:MAG: uncharacterized protein LCPAC401_05010 [Pithovirus LCPAC401]
MTERWEHAKKSINNGDFKAFQDITSEGVYLPYYMEYAAEKGKFDIVKYIGSKHSGTPKTLKIWNKCACGAAKGGHIDIFKYAESKGVSNAALMDSTSQHGAKSEIVEYCISKGYVTSDYLQSVKSMHSKVSSGISYSSIYIDSPERPIGIMKSIPK